MDALELVKLFGILSIAIAAHERTFCVLLDNNSTKCWGKNTNGFLGLGDTLDRGDQPGEMGDNLPTVDLGTVIII